MKRARFAVFAAACAALPGVVASVSSCSSDEGAAPGQVDGGDASDARPDRGVPPPEDAASEEASRPPPVLPSCVGAAAIPLRVSGQRAYVSVRVGHADAGADAEAGVNGPAGDFVVDFGTTGSTIDMAAFSERPVPESCLGDASVPGALCTFNGFDFFGDWGLVTLRTANHSTLTGPSRQAGILSTDFLSLYPFTLDYTAGEIRKAERAAFCSDGQLLAGGFVPLPSQGFYATDPSKLRPLSDVVKDFDGGSVKVTVANVPTVPVTIGGIGALAQLDTGYEDKLVSHSINVNEALFDALSKRGDILTRDYSADIFATTCIPGFSEQLYAYRLAPGYDVEFLAEGGGIARKETTVAIYVKRPTKESAPCGGISTWTVPAAQIGSSFYVDAQAIIFDPVSSRVWVPKN